jgi:hypothetical protein
MTNARRLTAVMANLYFCQSINRSLGILRAVLSWEDSQKLLGQHLAEYMGQHFPTSNPGRASDFAVLRIFDEESNDKWRSGFYSFDADIMQIEEALHASIAKV